jgi:adhesin/invasin
MSLTASALNANPAIATAVATQDLMLRVSGADQERAVGGALAAPIVVRLLDQAGEILVNEVVTFTPGAGSVSSATALTNLQGEAQTIWTLGTTAGKQTLTVRGGVALPVTFDATARAADSLAIVSGDAQAAQAGKTLAEPIVVRVVEKASGKAVPGATVTFAVTAANGSVSEASVVTDALGLARTSWTLGATTGAKTLTVSVGSPAVSRTVTATATVERLEVVAGANQTGRLQSTLPTPIAVRVIDLAGAPVSNVLVTFTPVVGSGSVLPTSIATDATGVARTVWTLGTTPGIQTLGVSAGAAGSLNVFATATRNRIELVSGGNQSARINAALADSITVRVVDPSGVAVPNVSVAFTASAGTPSPLTNLTNAQGITRTAVTMPATPGSVTLTASATNTDPLQVTARATQDRLTLVSGGDQVRAVGATLAAPIVIQLRDEAGAAMVDAQVSFGPSAGSVGSGSVRTDAQGQAQTTWTLGASAGPQTLTVNGGTATALSVAATALALDAISVVSGDAQAAQTGSALANPVVVRVRTTAGLAVPGATVTFTPAAATDGTVSAATVVTDIEGKAQTNWTLGTGTGAKTLRASVGSAPPVSFAATATADRLELVSGDGQVARPSTALTNPVVVRLVGLNGQVLPGVTVTFTASGGGALLPATVVTDATGIARTAWTLGAGLGVQQLTVTAGTAPALTVTATAAQNRVTLVSGGGQSARIGTALADSIVVKVVDPNGAAVPNVSVAFATASGSASPTPLSTDAQGLAKVRWTLGGTAGAVTLTASAANTDPLQVTATATRDSLTLVSGGGQVRATSAALAAPIVVRLRDAAGVAMAGVTVTFAPATGTDGVPSPATATTDAQGQAQTTWTLGTAAGTQTLNVTGGTAVTVPVTATGLAVGTLTKVSGDAQAAQAGTALANPLVVRVQTAGGIAVPGASVTFTPAAGSVALSPALTDADGRAQATWTLGTTTGVQNLTATAGTASAAFTATATAERLDLVSGGNQVARPGTILSAPVIVRLVGLNGQNLAGVTVSFTAGNGGAALPASVTTDADGTARTAWTLGNALGLQQLTVASGSASVLTVSATAAQNRITLVSGGGQSARINTALADSIVVKVVDPSGAAVPNVSVAFATASGSASPTPRTTDAQGLAKVRWTLGPAAGAVTLSASATGADPLDVSARALKADSVFLSAGGSQTGLVGAALPQEVVVEVRDKLSQVVMPGIAVTFTPNVAGAANDGTVSAATVITDAAGLARTRWTLGTTKGTKTLNVATVDAGALSLTATALQDTSRVVTIVAGPSYTGTVLRTLPSMTVLVRDRFNNPIVGDSIRWTDSLTNGITVSPTVSVTGADGQAATTPKLGIAVDSALVRARIVGRNETVTFLATGQVAYSAVETGNFFSCALTEEGRSYCWGYNRDRQLGKGGSTKDVDRPSTPITAGDSLLGPFQNFRQLALGRTHSCGVSVARKLICWGTGSGAFGATNPAEVNLGNTTVESVATGEAHSCYVDIDGFARCAGENALGQLGNNSTTATTGNAAVDVLDATLARLRFSKVAAGRSFTCGFRRLDPLDATSRIPYCWGDNALGQLGRNSTTGASTASPVVIPVGAPAAFDSTSIVTGLDHACVLSSGDAFCWGSNGFGQLGSSTAPSGPGERQLQMVPVTMPVGVTFVRLAAGEYHTCGLTATGAAYCWGRNSSGQVGDGTQTMRPTPTAVVVPAGVTFQSISLGELHSCAITGIPTANGTTTPIGAVYCWGDNEYGQIGDGTLSGNASPVLAPRRVVNQP